MTKLILKIPKKRKKYDPDLLVATTKSMRVLPQTQEDVYVRGAGTIRIFNLGEMPVYVAFGRDRKR